MNSVQQADHPPVQHYRTFDGGGLTTTNREQFATLTYEKGNHRRARTLLGCTTKIPENPRTVLPTTTSFFLVRMVVAAVLWLLPSLGSLLGFVDYEFFIIGELYI